MRVASDQTNTFTLGPILQFGREKSFLAFNPFFARTFGVNSTEGIDFNYAWQAKHEVATGVSVGIEGYGVVPNLGNSPGLDFQEHRIGPVLYFEKELSATATGGPAKLGKAMSMTDAKSPAPADDGAGGNAPKLAVEAGVLFGLTAGTQDVAFKLKGAITY